MNTLEEEIRASSFSVRPGRYMCAKVSEIPKLEDCFALMQDEDEMTAVFEESKADLIKSVEKNKDLWKLIEFKIATPFYVVGFLAKISNTIAAQGCNCLVISTYSKDYFLVRETDYNKVKPALLALGFKETE